MQDFSLDIDFWALVAGFIFLGLCYLLWKRGLSFAKPTLFFSALDAPMEKNWKVRLANLPFWLNILSLLLLLMAFIDPHFFKPKQPSAKLGGGSTIPTEGIAIYLLLDRSGSMAETVSATINDTRVNIRKEDLLKQVTKDFVAERTDDLIGLAAFARVPQILSPLTLDHKTILKELANFHVVQNREDDGTAMGYAIYKTVNMIAATKHYAKELAQKGNPAYEIKSSIIILVTDGLQDPSILDKNSRLRNINLDDAAAFAKQNDVRLYLINIDPNTYSDNLAPQRHQMERITALTGGKLYIVNDPGNLSQIYADINRLEKSVLPQEGISKEKQPNLYRRISFYPYFIGTGMFLLLMALLLNTLLLRRVP